MDFKQRHLSSWVARHSLKTNHGHEPVKADDNLSKVTCSTLKNMKPAPSSAGTHCLKHCETVDAPSKDFDSEGEKIIDNAFGYSAEATGKHEEIF